MRRLLAILIGSALAAVPVAAAAQPNHPTPAPAPSPQHERAHEHGRDARLGVMVIELNSELRVHFGAAVDRGILVARVEPGTPAARAGVQVGDVLTEVDGRAITDAADVRDALASAKTPDAVKIIVERDKQEVTLTARIDQRSARAHAAWQDLRVLPWLPPLGWYAQHAQPRT